MLYKGIAPEAKEKQLFCGLLDPQGAHTGGSATGFP
jgi:hypothetical protein